MLDTRGFMVGMNVAIASRTGQSAGVGFAIPVDRISRLVPKLIKFGKVTRPEMGISEVLETTAGLRIRRLTRGGAAEVAGLRGPQLVRRQYRLGNQIIERTEFDPKAADLIVAVNGRPVRTAADLLEIIDAHQPGDIVEVSVERDGDRQIIPVELGAT